MAPHSTFAPSTQVGAVEERRNIYTQNRRIISGLLQFPPRSSVHFDFLSCNFVVMGSVVFFSKAEAD